MGFSDIMASSNRTGLGVNKKRSAGLEDICEILEEYSLWAKEENEEPYMGAKDYTTLFMMSGEPMVVKFRGRKGISSLLSAHIHNNSRIDSY